MSFQRTRLRGAWVAALTGATIAQDRVYDTRIGNIQESDADQMLPLIAVYTEGDQRNQRAPLSGGNGVFERIIDVVIELTVATWANVDGVSTFVAPETDPELEAVLDALEMQLWLTVNDDTRPASIALFNMIKEIRGWDSRPGRTPEGNNKISARQLTIQCVVQDDTRKASDCLTTGAIFPTYLAPLLEIINTNPGYETLKAAIEKVTGQAMPAALEQMAGFNVTVDYIKHDTQEPDGTIDITGDWPTPTP
jgi:hypothetical protein